MLGFDLETFPNQSNMARSGRYLGNGPVTLLMTGTVAQFSKSISERTCEEGSADWVRRPEGDTPGEGIPPKGEYLCLGR
jgi:hypothetical protein